MLLPPPNCIFKMSHVFNATSNNIYNAWTQEQQLANWWGPKGFSINILKFDFNPGGTFHYRAFTPDFEIWGKFVYGFCETNKKIEFVNSFTNPEGKIIHAPFSDTWPLEIHNTISLFEQNGRTLLKIEAKPINANISEIETYQDAFESLNQGFWGTFEKLSEYLKTITNN